MKQLYTFILLFVFAGLFGQKNVTVELHHKLGDSNFTYNLKSTNDIGETFYIDRLQYYISEISLVHDNGEETAFPDIYVLVNSDEKTIIDLGSVELDQVEALRFHVGVNEPVNKQDPTQWPQDHALYPKVPSMHWGWAAGYRFVALEGKAGDNYDKVFQIHALGESNYMMTEVPLSIESSDNDIRIDVDADYKGAVNGFELSKGLINHGERYESVTLMQSFQRNVFTQSATTTNVQDIEAVIAASTYPNPTTGEVTMTWNGEVDVINIVDEMGRTIQTINTKGLTSHQTTIPTKGTYFISFIKGQNALASKTLIIK